MDGVDIINSLPDVLLIHILSFLPVKEIVKTSSVTRRWRNLCSYVPRLDFYSFSIHNSTIYTHLMRHNAPRIESFDARFSYHDSRDDACIDAILLFLADHGIEDLQLTVDADGGVFRHYKQRGHDCYAMHHCLAKCTTLKNLTVSCCHLEMSTAWLCFKSLKVLCLSSSFDTILDTSCCPLLEVLILDICSKANHLEIHAPNPTLRLLKLYLLFLEKDTSLSIYAPHALNLEIIEDVPGNNIVIKDLSSVTSVKLNCSCDSFTLLSWMTTLIKKFSHLRSLTLNFWDTSSNVVKLEIPPLDVTILKLYIFSFDKCIREIVLILQTCRYLESLIFDFSEWLHGTIVDQRETWDQFEATLYTLTCLKNVKMKHFFRPNRYLEETNVLKQMEIIDFEIRPIKLFLRCCPKLEKLEIFPDLRWFNKHEDQRLKFFHVLTKKVMAVPRASPNAQVSISFRCNMD